MVKSVPAAVQRAGGLVLAGFTGAAAPPPRRARTAGRGQHGDPAQRRDRGRPEQVPAVDARPHRQVAAGVGEGVRVDVAGVDPQGKMPA